MSSAYVMVCTCGGGRGRSAMYILSGTPVFMLRREDLVLLYSVYCFLPFM